MGLCYFFGEGVGFCFCLLCILKGIGFCYLMGVYGLSVLSHVYFLEGMGFVLFWGGSGIMF